MQIKQKAKNRIKYVLGEFIIFCQPKKALMLYKKGLTLNTNLSLKGRLIRFTLLEKHQKKNDFKALSKVHKTYWEKQGKAYFSGKYNNNTLENFFIPECSFLIDLLKEKLKNETENYNTLIEIGTGDGTVLDYLSSIFIQIDKFIGLDLSADQINANKLTFKLNSKLEFVSADGVDWIKKHAESFTIVLTSRGVLEYFTEYRLQKFLNRLKKKGKIIFIAIEPTAANHDFSINPNSQIYGHESSFSHNYAKLFKNAGFSIWHESRKLFSSEIYFTFFGAKTD